MNRIYPCPIHGEGKDRRVWGDVKRHGCGCPVLKGENLIVMPTDHISEEQAREYNENILARRAAYPPYDPAKDLNFKDELGDPLAALCQTETMPRDPNAPPYDPAKDDIEDL